MNWGIGGSGDLGAWLAEERYLYMARVLHSLLGHWSATLMSLQYIKHCSFRPARLAGWLAGRCCCCLQLLANSCARC